MARRRSAPAARMSPVVGASRPQSMRKVVVFPGAVGTKEPKDFAAPHLKSAVGNGSEAAKAPREVNRLHCIFPGEKCCRGIEVFALGVSRREMLEFGC